jgi:hypothetical protein
MSRSQLRFVASMIDRPHFLQTIRVGGSGVTSTVDEPYAPGQPVAEPIATLHMAAELRALGRHTEAAELEARWAARQRGSRRPRRDADHA